MGGVPAPGIVLIRSEEHMAWAADAGPDPDCLRPALAAWFGPPR
ncbi:hypothetical protein AB0O34_13280 [Sphaerisporangium sp. NPDC088356]